MNTKAKDTPNWTLPMALLGGGYLVLAISTTPVEAKPSREDAIHDPYLEWPTYEGLSIAEYDPELAAWIRERKAADQAERTLLSKYPIGDAARRIGLTEDYEHEQFTTLL